jgi:transposase
MQEISADKGYISMKNLQTAVDHGAVPFIKFKSNTQPDRGTDLWSQMFFYYNYKHEEFLRHYHKRSNVETTFQMIKSKFGERLRSKTETAQVNKALCKVLCHNLCVVIQSMYELNVTPEFWSEAA